MASKEGKQAKATGAADEASSAPKSIAKPAPVAEENWGGYVVAEGRTIQCTRGEMRAGERIQKGDFTSKVFETFKACGAIVKKK